MWSPKDLIIVLLLLGAAGTERGVETKNCARASSVSIVNVVIVMSSSLMH